MTQRFESKEAFYIDDERRRGSIEVDFGINWTEGARIFPSYRVSWIEATGEFYAQLLRDGRSAIELLGWARDREDAEAVMLNWPGGIDFDLDWVRHRLSGTLAR